MFRNPAMGQLVSISGSDPRRGSWEHQAFVPVALAKTEPELVGATYRAVAPAGRDLTPVEAARFVPVPPGGPAACRRGGPAHLGRHRPR